MSALGNFWTSISGQAAPVSTSTPVEHNQNYNLFTYDPRTGHLVNTQTGVQYALGPGQAAAEYSGGPTQIQNPNAATQILGATQHQNDFLNALNTYAQQQAQGFAGEQGLAGSLQNTINNPNAPSVARAQLQEALNASLAQQQAAAAGVSGDNAALARQNAMRNMGTLATQEGNEATMLRAKEAEAAQQNLANVLNNMAQQGQQGYNANTKAAEDYGAMALKSQTDLETANAEERQKNAANEQKTIGGGIQGLGTLLSL
jgi:hypothetical protein